MCSDPFLACLEEFGYSVIRLPVADLEPLELLLRRGDDLERFGRLATVFVRKAPAGPPRITRRRPAASISGRRTGHLDLGVGLSLLGGVIAAMGGSQIGLADTYRNARTITFEFRNVTEDRIELAALDAYLASARLSRRSAHVGSLLEDGNIYLTTSVIRSRSLTVEAHDERGAAVSVQVPALHQVADGHLSVSHDADNTAAVTYTGRTPLAFGFRAVRLFYDDGRYTGFEPLNAGDAALRRFRLSAESRVSR